jgi:hypothetical protein
MAGTLAVRGQLLGSKKVLFPDRFWTYPAEWESNAGRTTLRDLISRIVSDEVAAFRRRQTERRLFRVLTEREIVEGAGRGKIDPAGHAEQQEIAEEAAVSRAIEAFSDGLYFIFIDGEQQTDLHQPVYIQPNCVITFIRLVALAGG